MRLIVPMVALQATLLCAPLRAQQQPSTPLTTAAPSREAKTPESKSQSTQDNDAVGLDVPVSLDKIRGALAQPAPEVLKGMNERPTFRLEVQEHQRFEQLMDKIKFEGGGGPEVAGGRANYEMQQVLFPKVDNPRVQPYAAFSTGEVLTLGAEAIIEKLVVDKVSHIFGNMLRAQAEREAREEVARNLAAFQAAQPAPPPKN
jgi:hypothetical protein